MIGVEYLRVLEELAARQTRIYNDACDVGIYVTPEITTAIKKAMAGLANLEGMVIDTWTTGRSVTTRLGFEMEGGKVVGVKVTVSRQRYRRGVLNKDWYSIDIVRDSWEPNSRLGAIWEKAV